MSRVERAALPRVLRAAVIEDELHRRRIDRLTVVVGFSTLVNVVIAVWVAVHR